MALESLIPDEERAVHLKAQLDALQREYNALSRGISQRRYSLTLVGTLPPEVMGEMFVYAAGSDELAALILSQVCHAWRTMIGSTPRAWSTITVRLTRSKPTKLAALYFEQSRACPLHVAVIQPPQGWKHDPPESEILPLAELVRTHWSRIRIFRMYKMGGAVARTFLDACFPLDPLESPNSSQSCISLSPSPPPHAAMTRSPVRHIAFHLFPNHDPVLASDYADFRQMSTMFGDARDVSSFTLENGLPSYDLPLFNWGSLRSIQIEEPHMFTYSTPVDKILDILAANPMLHAFVLAGNRSVREPPVQDRGGALIVRLPALRVLSLQSVDIPYVLDNIACPILEKLKLGNELGAQWDGSVARSLRGMIERSDYPAITRLRINEIATPSLASTGEWACFEMMPELQSFRCHHTNFPDELLERFLYSADADPDVGATATTALVTPPSKVLCPRLIKLVFENCNLSGRALVALSEARTKKTGDVEALQELWTWQCPDVRVRDEKKLQAVLGDRYHPTLQKED